MIDKCLVNENIITCLIYIIYNVVNTIKFNVQRIKSLYCLIMKFFNLYRIVTIYWTPQEITQLIFLIILFIF